MKHKKIIVISAYIVGAILSFLLVFCAVALFTFAYYKSEKIFSKSGMVIALTKEFEEEESEEYTAYYTSNKIVVMTLKVEFTEFKEDQWNVKERTCLEYAKQVAQEYRLIYPTATEVVEDNELIYYTFDIEADGKIYTYLTATYQAYDAYWQVSLGCEKSNFDKLQEDIIEYAQSVSFAE